MWREDEPPRLPTARAQHPTTWAGEPSTSARPRPRRRPPRLPEDWERQLRAILAAMPLPARWLDVLAVVLRSGAPDWMVEFVGRLPEVDFVSVEAIVELCRPQARRREAATF